MSNPMSKPMSKPMSLSDTLTPAQSKIFKDLAVTGLYTMNQNQAMLAIEKQQYELLRSFFTTMFIGIGCLVVYVAARIYAITKLYKHFIQWIDVDCARDGWNSCSGLSISLCLTWNWYNYLFGCSSNFYFPFAVERCFATQSFRQAIDTYGHPGKFLNCLFILCRAITDQRSLDSLICTALLGIQSDAADTELCQRPCSLQESSTGEVIMSAVQGGMMGSAGGAGVGMALHSFKSIAGPAAIISIGVGAVVGITNSIMQTVKQKNELKQRCNTARFTHQCIPPPNLCG